jgi:hypothetical protein
MSCKQLLMLLSILRLPTVAVSGYLLTALPFARVGGDCVRHHREFFAWQARRAISTQFNPTKPRARRPPNHFPVRLAAVPGGPALLDGDVTAASPR